MTGPRNLRRQHLVAICRALAAYLEAGNDARLKTVVDDESLAELVVQLRGRSSIVFDIEDWGTFQEILETETNRMLDAHRCR